MTAFGCKKQYFDVFSKNTQTVFEWFQTDDLSFKCKARVNIKLKIPFFKWVRKSSPWSRQHREQQYVFDLHEPSK